MKPAAKLVMTEAEYLEFERASDEKHEYINGEVFAMAGGTPEHALIATNVSGALGLALRGRPCVAFQSELRVNVHATRLYTYPDIVVVCGKVERHPDDANTIVNPIVLIEVLSPGTEKYDREAKFAHYRQLASLREYALISTAERHVEHYRKIEPGQWLLTDHDGDATVPFPALDTSLSLVDVYAKLDLLATS